MNYEFNKMLEDARNLSVAAKECVLIKLDNDLVADSEKAILLEDCAMLYSIMDSIVEKLNMLVDEIA